MHTRARAHTHTHTHTHTHARTHAPEILPSFFFSISPPGRVVDQDQKTRKRYDIHAEFILIMPGFRSAKVNLSLWPVNNNVCLDHLNDVWRFNQLCFTRSITCFVALSVLSDQQFEHKYIGSTCKVYETGSLTVSEIEIIGSVAQREKERGEEGERRGGGAEE